ncbi:hypothetical protein NESM_000731700 [Novymonas esmeraldas]|uniref:Uncharacterized protein n=1 Tax=Novymonas esmeraldas TaxID=1808958 RepID=A0AAW0EUE6_9TRYP
MRPAIISGGDEAAVNELCAESARRPRAPPTAAMPSETTDRRLRLRPTNAMAPAKTPRTESRCCPASDALQRVRRLLLDLELPWADAQLVEVYLLRPLRSPQGRGVGGRAAAAAAATTPPPPTVSLASEPVGDAALSVDAQATATASTMLTNTRLLTSKHALYYAAQPVAETGVSSRAVTPIDEEHSAPERGPATADVAHAAASAGGGCETLRAPHVMDGSAVGPGTRRAQPRPPRLPQRGERPRPPARAAVVGGGHDTSALTAPPPPLQPWRHRLCLEVTPSLLQEAERVLTAYAAARAAAVAAVRHRDAVWRTLLRFLRVVRVAMALRADTHASRSHLHTIDGAAVEGSGLERSAYADADAGDERAGASAAPLPPSSAHERPSPRPVSASPSTAEEEEDDDTADVAPPLLTPPDRHPHHPQRPLQRFFIGSPRMPAVSGSTNTSAGSAGPTATGDVTPSHLRVRVPPLLLCLRPSAAPLSARGTREAAGEVRGGPASARAYSAAAPVPRHRTVRRATTSGPAPPPSTVYPALSTTQRLQPPPRRTDSADGATRRRSRSAPCAGAAAAATTAHSPRPPHGLSSTAATPRTRWTGRAGASLAPSSARSPQPSACASSAVSGQPPQLQSGAAAPTLGSGLHIVPRRVYGDCLLHYLYYLQRATLAVVEAVAALRRGHTRPDAPFVADRRSNYLLEVLTQTSVLARDTAMQWLMGDDEEDLAAVVREPARPRRSSHVVARHGHDGHASPEAVQMHQEGRDVAQLAAARGRWPEQLLRAPLLSTRSSLARHAATPSLLTHLAAKPLASVCTPGATTAVAAGAAEARRCDDGDVECAAAAAGVVCSTGDGSTPSLALPVDVLAAYGGGSADTGATATSSASCAAWRTRLEVGERLLHCEVANQLSYLKACMQCVLRHEYPLHLRGMASVHARFYAEAPVDGDEAAAAAPCHDRVLFADERLRVGWMEELQASWQFLQSGSGSVL